LLGRVGWGEVKISCCELLLIAYKDMNEMLTACFLFPLTQPSPFGEGFKNKSHKKLTKCGKIAFKALPCWGGLGGEKLK